MPQPLGLSPLWNTEFGHRRDVWKASAGVADPGLTVNHQPLTARGCRSSEWVREQLWGGTAGEPQPQPAPGCSHPLQKPRRSLWEPGLCSDWEGRKLLPQLPGFLTGSVPAPGFHSRNKSPAQYFRHVCVRPWQRMMMARNARNASCGSGCFPWRQTLVPPALNIRAHT